MEDLNSVEACPKTTTIVRRLFSAFIIPIGIGVPLSVAILCVQLLQEEKTKLFFIGLDGMCFYLAAGLLFLVIMGIALLRFRPRLIYLFVSVLAISSVFYGASKLLRIDGYNGDRTPRIVWRWKPKAEQHIKEYLTSRKVPEIALSIENLFRPTLNDFPEIHGGNPATRMDRVDIQSDWNTNPPKLLWRHPVGIGWSGFAVVGNAAVTLEQRDEYECVVCYELHNGIELWCHREKARFNHEHGDGPRSTPTIHDGRVYSMGATGIVTCLEFKTGEKHWSQSVFSDPTTQNLIFGMSGSPLFVDGLVVVTPGAGVGGATIAFDMQTGAMVWSSGDDPASYASPIVATLFGKKQILSFNGAGLRSFALDGQALWFQPWVTQGESRVNVAQPVVVSESTRLEDGARVLISSGYDKGTALLNVSLDKDRWSSQVVWESKSLKSKLSSVVVHENFVYGFDNGILACIDLTNGKRSWKAGRYGHGKMLLVRNKLLIQAESGEVVLVAANPTAHLELARFEALTSKTWNEIALSGNIMVVRNDCEAAAILLPINE
ncbi:MAG: PQQ-like beta-propeller repeat protein [Planctomycetota bacterium]|nr:PQQ-like beta-propeller repeat protein [Planctomycetota bacterium]